MKKKIGNYMGAVANAYIILIGAVLPLYMRDGLSMIGDAKYIFFMKYSLMALVLSGIGILGAVLCTVKDKERIPAKYFGRWSVTDSFAAVYGICTLLSFCFSSYKEDALFGFADWHMGLITQLLLVWIYFFVSRCYGGEKYVWAAAGFAAFGVFALGILNRYGFDPLGNFTDIDLWDWNRLNLLSTIGNINWYCGYVCLVFPGMLYLYWGGRTLLQRVLGGIGSFAGFLTLFTQGSSSGYAGMAAAILVLFYFSLSEVKKFRRFAQVLLLMASAPVLITSTLPLLPGLALPVDGVSYEVIFWKGWYGAVPVTGAWILVWAYLDKSGRGGKFLKQFGKIAGISFLAVWGAGILIFLLCQISDSVWAFLGRPSLLRIDSEWGSGRGALWKLSLRCFLEGGWLQKLLGAGPDCFAPVIYGMFNPAEEIFVSGQWREAIFANAHNEWLNMLVTGGIGGAVSYLGIFLSAVRRFARKARELPVMVMGVMMIAGYAANDIFSFQQIVSAPVLFVMLGMMEHFGREKAFPENLPVKNG